MTRLVKIIVPSPEIAPATCLDGLEPQPLPSGRRRLLPTITCFCLLFITLYFNCVLQVVCENVTAKMTPPPTPLRWDLGFRVVPRIHPDAIADVWVGVCIVLTAIRFGVTRLRHLILRRWATNLAFLFALRSFAIVLTLLPNPQTSCRPTAMGNPWLEALRILAGQHKTCADMFFSGHVCNLTLVGLVWHQYSHLVPVIDADPLASLLRFSGWPVSSHHGDVQRMTTAKLLAWVAVVIGMVFVLGTRLHYSIDVFSAFIFSVLTFKLYHHYIKTCNTRNNWFNKLLFWLEKDAEDITALWASTPLQAPASSPPTSPLSLE